MVLHMMRAIMMSISYLGCYSLQMKRLWQREERGFLSFNRPPQPIRAVLPHHRHHTHKQHGCRSAATSPIIAPIIIHLNISFDGDYLPHPRRTLFNQVLIRCYTGALLSPVHKQSIHFLFLKQHFPTKPFC